MTHADVRPTEHTIETPNGSVFVRETPGEEPTVVLMHGFPDDSRIYSKLQTELSPRRSVAFDFLGYGRSDRPNNEKMSYEDHEVELTAILDQLGIEQAVLVGHDTSGPDAVLYAVDHPQRVARVVLLNTIFGHQPSLRMPEMTRLFADPQLTSLADDLTNDPNQLLWLLTRWAAQFGFDSDVVTGSILAQFLGDDDQPEAHAAIRAWTTTLHDGLTYEDSVIESGALRELEVPVSVIFGEDDPYLGPSLAAELSALFKTSALQILPGAGHYPQDDQPAAVAELLKGV